MSLPLRVTGLRKSYGKVHALQGVDFELSAGECVALIGPNGAGKSTCFACIAGQKAPDVGRVIWREQDILNSPAHKLRQMGVARTFQVAQVFEALSVIENLQLVLKAALGVSALDVLQNSLEEEAWHWVHQMGLDNLGEQVLRSSAANLSYGSKKRLELAMAMAGLPDPQTGLLLLDEPAAGLSPVERLDMMHRIQSLALKGTTVLYTEHNMDAVFGVADRVMVLIDGLLVAQGSPSEVALHPVVVERYLGRSFVWSEGTAHA